VFSSVLQRQERRRSAWILVALTLVCGVASARNAFAQAQTQGRNEPNAKTGSVEKTAPNERAEALEERELSPEQQRLAAELAQKPIPWHVWPLFDPFVDRHEVAFAGGLQQRRLASEQAARDGWYAAYAFESVTTQRSHLFVRGQRSLQLRVNRGAAYALDLLGLSYFAGAQLGPLELGAGVQLVPLTIHYEKEWDLGGLSPGALLQANLRLGNVMLGVRAFEQYSWRWTAAEDTMSRGIGFELAFIQPQVLRRGSHPIIPIYD
jgi:hypothetical protein